MNGTGAGGLARLIISNDIWDGLQLNRPRVKATSNEISLIESDVKNKHTFDRNLLTPDTVKCV